MFSSATPCSTEAEQGLFFAESLRLKIRHLSDFTAEKNQQSRNQ
jgi:hypothetical protein